ncbi:MAG: GNAT family N-acetyltransferase [Flavobacteriaceae bacterium]|nr:GNAT family N-acetyltransferase [Flavobacteriaceae bacterium]
MNDIKTYFLTTSNTESQIADLAELINERYDATEGPIWNTPGTRTNVEQLKELIQKRELIIATKDKKWVGCIHVKKDDADSALFGMLVANPQYKGQRIGTKLICRAEQWAIAEGLQYMKLELLIPRDIVLESKIFLTEWYQRIGYKQISSGLFEEVYPHKKDFMATPCDFNIWRKKLI